MCRRLICSCQRLHIDCAVTTVQWELQCATCNWNRTKLIRSLQWAKVKFRNSRKSRKVWWRLRDFWFASRISHLLNVALNFSTNKCERRHHCDLLIYYLNADTYVRIASIFIIVTRFQTKLQIHSQPKTNKIYKKSDRWINAFWTRQNKNKTKTRKMLVSLAVAYVGRNEGTTARFSAAE